MNDIIIALDFSSKEEVYDFLSDFNDEKLFLKIGMELYYKEGNDLVRELKSRGHKIFLDLKLNDIPNTVHHAIKNLVELEVDIITVHTLGGKEMLTKAKEAALKSKTKIIGITILTSISQDALNEELNISSKISDQVQHLSNLAYQSGLDGVVCSALDLSSIKKLNMLYITPAIRMKEDDKHDQKRACTPREAKENGSDLLVIGRSITQKETPYDVYKGILADIQ